MDIHPQVNSHTWNFQNSYVELPTKFYKKQLTFDEESTKFLYYYISEMQDYNTIEISARSDSVSGFEWD